MKSTSIVNWVAASVLTVATMASTSVSASDSPEDQVAMNSWQHEIAGEISENGHNALKIMMMNVHLDNKIEMNSGFHTLRNRVAEDEVECEEESLASEPETIPQEEAAVSFEVSAPGMQIESLITISSLASGVIQ